jgi:hypothetical protein
MKKVIFALAVFISFLVVIRSAQPVWAQEGSDFSVIPLIGENQVGQDLGYFNLLLAPQATQKLSFRLINHSNRALSIKTSFGNAFTTNLGTVSYKAPNHQIEPSLSIDLQKRVTLPSTVSLNSKESIILEAKLTMPKESFQGILAGGFNFEEESTNRYQKENSIQNNYAYTFALIVQNSLAKVAPALSLGKVSTDQINGKQVLLINPTNHSKTYLKQMNLHAVIAKTNNFSLKDAYDNSAMEMAPDSSFTLALPLSNLGFNDQKGNPLESGHYQLKLLVYGEKSPNGIYQTSLNQQTTNYNDKWELASRFTVPAKQANVSKIKKAEELNLTFNWVIIIEWTIIIFLISTIFYLIFKSLKKHQEKN